MSLPSRQPDVAQETGAGRVLVVEDDPMSRAMLAAWLHSEGYAYEVAGDARAARAALAAREFDLLICDVQLPDADGPDIVAGIDGINRGLPVVFLTGRPSLETAIRSVQLRIVAYLVKPPDLDELRDLVGREVALHRHRRALAASRRRVQAWDAELARMESAAESSEGTPLVEHLQLHVRQLAALLLDLDRSVSRLTAQPAGRDAFERIDLVASLRHTVRVLEKTRHNFKSKELGDLRKELEGLLVRIGPTGEAPTSGDR